MTSRVRVAIAVGVAVVLGAVAVVAFASGRGQRPVPMAAPSPSPSGEASPTVVVTPRPAPSPTVAIRLPDNKGDDPVAAMKEIVRFRDEIFHAPDPDLVRYIYAPECDCYDSLRQTLDGMASNGWRTLGSPAHVREASLQKREHELAWVRYHVVASPLTLEDADGKTLKQDPGGDEQVLEAVLLKDSTGRWRVQDIRDVSRAES